MRLALWSALALTLVLAAAVSVLAAMRRPAVAAPRARTDREIPVVILEPR